jgi:hypothetical protein
MNAIDPIDELVARSKNHPKLRQFHAFHKAHPEVFDFLVSEIQARLDSGLSAFSNSSLWQYARWKLEMQRGPGETFLMNDHVSGFYGRALVVLHPEFNGRAEFRKCIADEVFGLRIEAVPQKRALHYARRLQWADGTPLEEGWRPQAPHVVTLPANRRRTVQRPK